MKNKMIIILVIYLLTASAFAGTRIEKDVIIFSNKTTFASNSVFESKVGIGTNDPAAALHVKVADGGDVRILSANEWGGLLGYDKNEAQKWRFAFNNTEFLVGTLTNIPLVFQANDTEHMRITSGGNVGIGTNNPANSLHVHNASAAQLLVAGYSPSSGRTNVDSGAINLGSLAGYHGALDYDADGFTTFNIDNSFDNVDAKTVLRMRTAGTPVTALAVLGSGNVGIGTNVPAQKLHVRGNIQIGDVEDNAKAMYLTSQGGYSKIQDHNDTRLMINQSSGNVGIGSAVGPGYRFHVRGSTTSEGAIRTETGYSGMQTFQPNDNADDLAEFIVSNSNATRYIYMGLGEGAGKRIATAGDNVPYVGTIGVGADLVFGINNSEAMRISADKNVGIGTNAPEAPLHIHNASTAQLLVSGYSPSSSRTNADSGAIMLGNIAGYHGTLDYNADGNTTFNIDNTYDHVGAKTVIRMRTTGTPVDALSVLGSGNVGIGTTDPLATLQVGPTAISVASDKVAVSGTKGLYASSEGLYTNQLSVYDNTSMAKDVGGAINFMGNYTGTSPTWFGAISGVKENATDENYAGALIFNTRTHGANNTEKMRISSTGNVGIGTTNPVTRLDVDGTIRQRTGGWDDLVNDASKIRVQGTVNITVDENNNGLNFTTGATTNLTDDHLWLTIQMPHGWNTNTSISPHIHFIQTATDQTNMWLLRYKATKLGDTVPADWTVLETTSNQFTYSAGSINQVAEFTNHISAAELGISALLDVKIYRFGTRGTGTVLLKQFDIHYQRDSFGSNDEYSKNY